MKKTSERESHDNLDQLLNIDNLPKSGLHVNVVLKTISGNVLMRSSSDERTKCLVRQICDQNLHAAANTTVKYSVYSDVLTTVKENASNKMSDYLNSLTMTLATVSIKQAP